ncbi:MAG TPA: transposase, partial [Thermodesulfobacteriota bacterium]|nr:transposase [Thermodesulfobacteriota bacterium]
FGTLHHVMVRGIEKSWIFEDDEDRKHFLRRLGPLALETETRIYAWSLLTNHAHLLLKSGPEGLPGFMRRLLTGYAIFYNKRHCRYGHLFQNRYKSIICDEDAYFQELVRYIHLNPIRAGLVDGLSELDQYPWCGHSALMGNRDYTWQDLNHVLAWFGKKKKLAQVAYRKYLEEGISQGRRPDLVGGGMVRSLGGWSAVLSLRRSDGLILSDERILGTGDFVERILREAEQKIRYQFASQDRERRTEEIIKRKCREEAVSPEELKQGSRRGRLSQVRLELARQLTSELGIPLAEIARHLGVSTSAISKLLSRNKSL